ncbi:hypothetical protein U14_01310 [Candidatus Moduliflexus flocculans]|uniref:Uncharacterized protein n=1 Tax=Candidatus Moduliflexus flocculans TaxID=1499966 RepID=A0A0S6VVE9_9BACT|nr:hypothetical protein U14_01310 [Candidatus Moduliflexus flocculans]
MSTMTIAEPLQHLLQEFTIKNPLDIIKDYLVTEILCKISDFTQEVRHFEAKYGQSFQEFEAAYHAGEEDFARYDDLMAWEFAQQGKAYWEKRLEGMKHVL